MRRILFVISAVLATSAIAAPAAFADSPHYVTGPTATVNAADNSLTVSWKAAGLGSTVTSANFSLTGTVNTTAQCFTKSGNPVQGVPKSATTNVNASGTFPVRNGQTTGSLTVKPLSPLTCTGGQHVVILSASFNLTLTGDSLPPVTLTG